MKEPWKKTGDGEQQQKAGKVVITLNDETKSEPTEVEVPVDLNWTHRRERKCSAPKVVVLVGVVLLLGLTVITLFKVQNLIYSTSYINWRMQEIESAVKDSNEDITMMKFKMSLDARDEAIMAARAARAEPLIAAMANSKSLDSQDLKLSESQNQNHKLTNSLSEPAEAKDMKDSEVQSAKGVEAETSKDAKSKDTTGEDGRDHPNPADPEEWIKPLVETFDILGNQPVEDQFIQNVLMKLLMPENNFEVLEFKKIREGENSVGQEMDNQREMMSPPMRSGEDKMNKPLPFPLENILMKTLLPPISNFKVFHFNEKSEPQSEEDMSQKMMPIQSMKMKPMLPPPIEGLVKSLLPPTSNMKIFRLNDNNRPQQEQSAEEDMPKITIQSIKLKLIPMPSQEEFGGRRDSPGNLLGNGISSNENNFEMIRMNESPEPSQKVEAPRMSFPPQFGHVFPFPIQEIMRSILPTSKHIEIIPLNDRPMQQQQDRDMEMNQQENQPPPFPLEDMIKTLLTAPPQNSEEQYSKESQEQQHQQQQNPQVEVTKVPVRTIKLTPFHHALPEALMKPEYNVPMDPYEDDEDRDQAEQQQHQPMDHMQMQQQHQPMDHMQMQQQPMDHMQMQQQQQPMDHMQMQQQHQQPFEFMQMQQQQQQQIPLEPQQQQQLPEVPRPNVRSTKLNPVDSWNMSPPPQAPKEPVQQN